MRLLKRGSYSGRLAFDSDSGFHLAEDGARVVSVDGGISWRYATDDDLSHTARYSERLVGLTRTTPDDPHHVHPLRTDPHFEQDATYDGELTHTRLRQDDDKIGHLARRERRTELRSRLIGRKVRPVSVKTDVIERGDPKATSHTDSWKGQV